MKLIGNLTVRHAALEGIFHFGGNLVMRWNPDESRLHPTIKQWTKLLEEALGRLDQSMIMTTITARMIRMAPKLLHTAIYIMTPLFIKPPHPALLPQECKLESHYLSVQLLYFPLPHLPFLSWTMFPPLDGMEVKSNHTAYKDLS